MPENYVSEGTAFGKRNEFHQPLGPEHGVERTDAELGSAKYKLKP